MAVLAAGLISACAGRSGSDRVELDETTADGHAERQAAALALCQPIRDWVNATAEAANAATAAVGETDDPRERTRRALEGYDAIINITMTYQMSLATLAITGTADGPRAVEDLRSGAAGAVEIARAERAEFEADTATGIDDDDLVGRMGQFLISLETVYSAAEPPVARYTDRLFQQAVLDEPACDHVVQPFRL